MEFITVVIGRLVDGEPMPAREWVRFRHQAVKVLRELVAAVGTGEEILEISDGTTVWRGRTEPCMMATLMGASSSLVPAIRENLRDLLECYGQDAIGIRYGRADLITKE